MSLKMPKILVVDDSRMFLQVLVKGLQETVFAEVLSAESLADATELLERHEFDLAMLDLNLPDAPQGEVVDLVLARGIPVIVFAADCADDTRTRLWSKNIVDYVVKEGAESLNYAIRQARRVIRNRDIKTLVVEDSETVRTMLAELLRVHRFQVFEARNGREALSTLNENPEIQLIITDFEMPEMDGIRFVREVRARHPKEELAVIGISSHETENLSARFLKSGANDFLIKPFSSEEFYCRVSQNVDLLEYIRTIKEFSEKDFLTGLYNRRYLFSQGAARLRKKQRSGGKVYVAMLDIDHFKTINDRYGHEKGDAVLQELGEKLRLNFDDLGIAVRLGGEEFCLLLDDVGEDVVDNLEHFRRGVSSSSVMADGSSISFTVSIGLCASTRDDIETMIRRADNLLYRAKAEGRDRLAACLDDAPEEISNV
jgi:diguanylate cyclase (GGDEF)-like protein